MQRGKGPQSGRYQRCPLQISLSFQYPICHKKEQIEPRAKEVDMDILWSQRLRAKPTPALHIELTVEQPCKERRKTQFINSSSRRRASERRGQKGDGCMVAPSIHPSLLVLKVCACSCEVVRERRGESNCRFLDYFTKINGSCTPRAASAAKSREEDVKC